MVQFLLDFWLTEVQDYPKLLLDMYGAKETDPGMGSHKQAVIFAPAEHLASSEKLGVKVSCLKPNPSNPHLTRFT